MPITSSESEAVQELKYLDGVVKEPQRPLVAIVGGSKVSTKIPVLTSLTERVNKIIVGQASVLKFIWDKLA